MKKTLTFLTLLIVSSIAFAQQSIPSRLKIFIDCSSWCDIQYIRSEINIVDFLLDNAASDVHVLITSYSTGSGGREYQLIFFGQQSFKNQTDTLRFSAGSDATEFETRDLILKSLKAGLVPFISKTGSAKNMEISLKTEGDNAEGSTDTTQTKDPWNAWVFRIGANGNINADANYKDKRYSGNFSTERITDKIKTRLGIYGSKNKSVFEFAGSDSTQVFEVNNHNWSVEHSLVRSISPHLSWSYEVSYNQNTFSNIKGGAFAWIAGEYNIFPYKEVSNKLFTFSYGITARHNTYYDTTIYNKTEETLYGHQASAYVSFNQKWGNAYAGITYHNYFHDWSLYNLGVNIYTSVRITGGLSFYVAGFGGLTRDQLFLVKGNATPEEVLARRRQLASGYNYYTSVGLSYRFGSKLNNVVNPRFDSSSTNRF
ncbi:MAG: hypothetical protein ABIR66_01745 [Saprospiraceae bacterium]